MNQSNYLSQIDQIFDKLETSSRRATKTHNANIGAWQVGLLVTGLAAGGSSGVAMISMGLSLPSIVTGGALLLSGLALGSAGNYEYSTAPIVQFVLGLAGRSLPLSESQAKDLSRWSQQHPRLAPILATWAATNKDGVLNRADYNRAAKQINRVEFIKEEAQKSSSISDHLRVGGIEAATRRVKLTKISQEVSNRSDSPSSKPAM